MTAVESNEHMTQKRWIWLIVGAFFWRLAISALTPVPSPDGANYLWMAERFAAGEPGLALSEVFPPLFSLAIAPFVWLGLEPFRAGQLACCLAGAASLFAIARVCELVEPSRGRAAWLAGLMVLCAPLPTRLGAEVQSEALFIPVAAAATFAALRGRMFECGLWSGLAFGIRPEGAAIAVVFGLWQMLGRPGASAASGRAKGALALLGLAGPVVGLAAWRMRATAAPEWEWMPKFGFNAERLWGEDGPTLGGFAQHFAGNLLEIPWLWVEAFAVVGLLAVVGLFARDRRELWPWRVLVCVGIFAIAAFLPRRRFLLTWYFAIVPLAVIGLRRLPARAADLALILVLVTNLLLSLRVPGMDRYAERVVADVLVEVLRPGERITGDLTRVIYFAGQRPLPPRHFSVDELVSRAKAPDVRFVVLGSKRDTAAPVMARLEEYGFVFYDLPAKVRGVVEERGITVLHRPR